MRIVQSSTKKESDPSVLQTQFFLSELDKFLSQVLRKSTDSRSSYVCDCQPKPEGGNSEVNVRFQDPAVGNSPAPVTNTFPASKP